MQAAHGRGNIGHPCRETPFVVVPSQHAHSLAANNFGLIWREDGAFGGVVEVNRDFLFRIIFLKLSLK